jgi:hypothetical protein
VGTQRGTTLSAAMSSSTSERRLAVEAVALMSERTYGVV